MKFPLLTGLVLLALLHAAMAWLAGDRLDERRLSGPDAYNRLVQVSELRRSFDWQQPMLSRSNVPYGAPRAWTRAFDLPLLAATLALEPFFDSDEALYHAGVWSGPTLHVLALLALLWATAPLLSRRAAFFLAVLLPFQVSISIQFRLGAPDHHALQSLLFFLLVSFAIRLVSPAAHWRWAVLAGLTVAAAVWVSVEGLLIAASLLLALGVDWVRNGRAGTSGGFTVWRGRRRCSPALPRIHRRTGCGRCRFPQAWRTIDFSKSRNEPGATARLRRGRWRGPRRR